MIDKEKTSIYSNVYNNVTMGLIQHTCKFVQPTKTEWRNVSEWMLELRWTKLWLFTNEVSSLTKVSQVNTSIKQLQRWFNNNDKEEQSPSLAMKIFICPVWAELGFSCWR